MLRPENQRNYQGFRCSGRGKKERTEGSGDEMMEEFREKRGEGETYV